MRRQLQGIALILLAILLAIGFRSVGWTYFFDLSLYWQHIFMLMGIAGAVLVFWPDKKEK